MDEAILQHIAWIMELFMRELARIVSILRPSTTVFLGRDADLLAPVWKLRGYNAQVFHWARITRPDAAKRRWLDEVPPHALVVDTGFRGHIPLAIRGCDELFGGAILINADRYRGWFRDPFWTWDEQDRQVLEELVGWIEDLPKFHKRVVDYLDSGRAVPAGPGTQNDSGRVDPVEARVVREVILRRLLGSSELALAHSDGSIYLTPEGRIGLGDQVPPDYVERNWEKRRVAKMEWEEIMTANPLKLAAAKRISLLALLRKIPVHKVGQYWEEATRRYGIDPDGVSTDVEEYIRTCAFVAGADE